MRRRLIAAVVIYTGLTGCHTHQEKTAISCTGPSHKSDAILVVNDKEHKWYVYNPNTKQLDYACGDDAFCHWTHSDSTISYYNDFFGNTRFTMVLDRFKGTLGMFTTPRSPDDEVQTCKPVEMPDIRPNKF